MLPVIMKPVASKWFNNSWLCEGITVNTKHETEKKYWLGQLPKAWIRKYASIVTDVSRH